MKTLMLIIFGCCLVTSLQAQEILSLERCREMALQYNQDVRSAQLNVQSANSLAKASKGDFQPTLDFSGNYRRLSNGISFDGFETGGSLEDVYNARLSLIQNVYSGNKVKNSYKLAQEQETIALAQQQLSESDVIFATDLAYWNAVTLAEVFTLSQAYRNVVNSFLVVVRDKVEAEIVPRNDLLQGQVRLNEAELIVIRSENALQIARMGLNRLIGNDINANIITADSISVDLDAGDQANVRERALQNRAEVKIQQGQVDSNLLQEKLTQSKYSPDIGIGLSGRFGAPSGAPNFDSPEFDGSAFAAISVPIHHGGKKKNELAADRFNTQISQLQLEKTQDLISLEAFEAQYALNESIKQVNLTNNSLGQAFENLDLVTERYIEGLANITEVFDAQIFWQRAYVNFIESKSGFQLSKSKFQRALGEL